MRAAASEPAESKQLPGPIHVGNPTINLIFRGCMHIHTFIYVYIDIHRIETLKNWSTKNFRWDTVGHSYVDPLLCSSAKFGGYLLLISSMAPESCPFILDGSHIFHDFSMFFSHQNLQGEFGNFMEFPILTAPRTFILIS
jgi:hypothetical protein